MSYKPQRTINLLTIIAVIGIIGIVIFLTVGYTDSAKIKSEHVKTSDLVVVMDNFVHSSSDDDYSINSTQYVIILDSCDDISEFDSHVGLVFYNGTHYIDNFTCEWELVNCDLMDIKCLERNIPEYFDDTKEDNFDEI